MPGKPSNCSVARGAPCAGGVRRGRTSANGRPRRAPPPRPRRWRGRGRQQPADDHRGPRCDGRAACRARARCRAAISTASRARRAPRRRAGRGSSGPPGPSRSGGQRAGSAPSAVSSRVATLARSPRRSREPGAVPAERDPDARASSARSATGSPRRPGLGGVARADPLELRAPRRPPRARRGAATLSRSTWPVARGVALAVGVAAADLERRHAQRLGDAVEVGLGGELDLRRAEAAERAVGRRVGHGRARPDPDVRAAVRAAGVDAAARQHHRRERAVRAAVEDELDVLGDERAVARDAGPVADRPPGGASSSRRCPRGGRRSSAPAGRPCGRGARRGGRSSTGTPPCRRTRRRSPPGPRRPCSAGRSERPASAPCGRSTGTGASRGSRCRRPRAGSRSSPGSRCRAAPGGRSGTCPRGRGRRPRSRRRGRPSTISYRAKAWSRGEGVEDRGQRLRAEARSRRGRPGPGRASGAATSATGSRGGGSRRATRAGWSRRSTRRRSRRGCRRR